MAKKKSKKKESKKKDEKKKRLIKLKLKKKLAQKKDTKKKESRKKESRKKDTRKKDTRKKDNKKKDTRKKSDQKLKIDQPLPEASTQPQASAIKNEDHSSSYNVSDAVKKLRAMKTKEELLSFTKGEKRLTVTRVIPAAMNRLT